MSYEYNHSILFDLDHLSQYEDVIDLDEKKIELDEVYAKAEAFDECVKALSIVKVSANPRDLMQAYDDIGKILEPYVFESERSE